MNLERVICSSLPVGRTPRGGNSQWLVQDAVEAADLIHLLPDWNLPGQPLHLIYPSRHYLPLRTRAFLQFMSERLPALPGFRAPQSSA